VGSAFLFGAVDPTVSSRVIDGPERTPSFDPAPGSGGLVSYPSVMVSARRYGDDLYVIAVNSVETAVSAEIVGLPIGVSEAALPFEDEAVAVEGGRVALAFPGLGVHILVMRSAFSVSPPGPSIPGVLVLDAARPNPFRSADHAALSFVMPQEGQVRADLYDLQGRRVAVLFDGIAAAGRHPLDVVPQGLPAGSYVVRLQGLGAFASRRITLTD
jgi:hypothetical protein